VVDRDDAGQRAAEGVAADPGIRHADMVHDVDDVLREVVQGRGDAGGGAPRADPQHAEVLFDEDARERAERDDVEARRGQQHDRGALAVEDVRDGAAAGLGGLEDLAGRGRHGIQSPSVDAGVPIG